MGREFPQERLIERVLLLDKAFQRALKVILEAAVPVTDPKDSAYVKQREATFRAQTDPQAQRAEKMATILEAIIYDCAQSKKWLGKNAVVIKSSRFDDISNGVDNIVEFNEKDSNSRAALAVDATISAELAEKFSRAKKEINEGRLAAVKYFSCPCPNHPKGEPIAAPRFIVSVSAKMTMELAQLWLENESEELEKHPVQYIIIQEMAAQAKAFKNYALKIGQPKIAATYEEVEKIISNIQREKGPLAREEVIDEAFAAMDRQLLAFQ